MRVFDKRQAIEMRLSGATYSHIKNKIGVSKSTLSDWLKNIELTSDQINAIKKESISRRVENYIKATQKRRRKISREYYEQEKRKLLPLSQRDLLITGLFLYLGEGAKVNRSRIQITNSDPSIIKFSIFWIINALGIEKNKLRIQLHLYTDMNIENEINFWQNVTTLSRSQFIKPYIKKASSQRIDHPSFGHGTCSVYCNNAKIKDEIMAGIRVILDSIIGRIV